MPGSADTALQSLAAAGYKPDAHVSAAGADQGSVPAASSADQALASIGMAAKAAKAPGNATEGEPWLENLLAGYGAETENIGHSLANFFIGDPDASHYGPLAGAPEGSIVAGAPTAPKSLPKPLAPLPEDEQAMQDALFANSGAASVGRVGADVANTLPFAMLGGEAVDPLAASVAGKGLGPTMLRAGISGSGQGAGAAFAMPAENGQQRLANMGTGALTGLLLNPAFAGAGAALSKGGNLLKSMYEGARGIGPGAEDLAATAAEHSIPLTAGEQSGNVGEQWLETANERVPFSGMKPWRAETQAPAFQADAQRIADMFDTGGDPAEQVQAAAQSAFGKARATAAAKYDRVAQLAAEARGYVNLDATKDAAAGLLSKFDSNDDLLPTPSWVAKIKPFMDADSRPYGSVQKLAQKIGAYASDAAPGSQESLAWTTLQKALRSDMEDFATQTPGSDLQSAYEDATNFYKNAVVPFKDPKLRNLATGQFDTDTLVSTFAKNNRPQLAQSFIQNLPPEGVDAMRAAVIQKGMQDAGFGSETQGFSPVKFSNWWNRLGATRDALFDADSQQYVNGYAKLVAAVPRLSKFAENPNTGIGVLPFLEGGAALMHPVGAAGVAGVGNMFTKLSTNPMGQKLLKQAAISAGPAIPKLAQQMISMMPLLAQQAAVTRAITTSKPAAAPSQ